MSRNRKDTNRNMRRFPDFAELLTPIGRRAMDGRVPKFNSMLASKKTPFALLTGLIDREKAGFLEMLRSESFTAFAQALTGYRLSSPPNLQILCYEHGDYVGPHNDHFPEEDPQCRGYIDFHVTLSNRAVAINI